MKTMMIATLMVLTATSTVFAAGKDCDIKNKMTQLASAAQAIEEKTVVDERIEIDRTKPEFKQLNAIGVVTPGDMSAFGTGFMVDSCHVLTNHHGFQEKGQSVVGKSATFSVGQTGSNNPPFTNMKVPGKIIAAGDYTGTESSANADWVIIRLAKSVSKDVGSIPLYQMDGSKQAGKAIITAGYPGNKTSDGNDLSKMYGDTNCKIIGIGLYGNNYYNCQATSGQSGSPLLAKGNDGKYYAIGMTDHRFDMTRSENPNIANIGVNFMSGKKVNVESDGDKIAKSLAADPCQ